MLHRLKPRRPALAATAIALISGALFVAGVAESASDGTQNPGARPTSACPDAASLGLAQLHGHWQVLWPDQPQASGDTMRFGHNPEFPDSLSGELRRGALRLQVAGDVDDGQLTLEESPDGKSIGATWIGQLQAGSCGTVFTGEWTRDASSPKTDPAAPDQRRFVLRRSPAW